MMIETAVPRVADEPRANVRSIQGKVSRALYSVLVCAFCLLIAYQGISAMTVAMAVGEELATGRTVMVTAQPGTDLEHLYGELDRAARQEGLAGLEPVGVIAFNAAGDQVVKAGETKQLDEFSAPADDLVARSVEGASIQRTRVGDHLLIAAPVTGQDGKIGGVVVAVWSQTQLRSDVLGALLPHLLTALVGALGAVFVAILLVRYLVLSPLVSLSRVADQIQSGKGIGVMPARLLKRGDEIGKLAVRFQDLFAAPRHHVEHVTKVGEHSNAALEHMSQGLCMFNGRHELVLRNSRFLDVYGLSEDMVPLGMELWDFMDACKAAGTHTQEQLVEMEANLAQQLRTLEPLSYVETLKNGRSLAVGRVPMADGGWVTTFEDITERRRAEAQIEHMALHDALTGLSNRVSFSRQLETALSQISRRQRIGIFLLDLDRFKAVNDTLGHPVGDELLKAMAARLQSCVRPSTIVARLGGDEFALFERDLASMEEAEGLASRIIETVSRPYDLEGHNVVIGTSVGIAIAPTHGTQADMLIKGADLALYRAKADGRGRYRFFELSMDTQGADTLVRWISAATSNTPHRGLPRPSSVKEALDVPQREGTGQRASRPDG